MDTTTPALVNDLENTNSAPRVKFFPKGTTPAFASFGQSHSTPFGHVSQDMYFNNLDALKAFANNIELAIAQWEQDEAKQAAAKAVAEAAANTDAAPAADAPQAV